MKIGDIIFEYAHLPYGKIQTTTKRQNAIRKIEGLDDGEKIDGLSGDHKYNHGHKNQPNKRNKKRHDP